MSETELIYYVRNWWKYQHYIARRPPWIKLHRSIETDPDFQSLSEINQYRLIKLWLLASDLDGTWRGHIAYLTRTWRLHRHLCTAQVLAEFESKGLISKQDVRGLKRSNASASQRQGRDRGREEKNNPPTPLARGAVASPPNGNKNNQALEDHAEFIRSIGTHATPDQKQWLERFEGQKTIH